MEHGWWVLMMATGMVASCRSHLPLCRGAGCEAAQTSLAGAAPSEQMTAGAAGQASAPLACSSDAECSNDLRCDGEERCADGKCESGEPVACPHPEMMHCEEDASEQCVLDTPSPWLIIGQGNTLAGLPTSEIGRQIERRQPITLITLATRPPSRALGFALPVFGTAGPFALVVAGEEEFLLSAKYFRLGAGLPSELRLVPDVPDTLDSLDVPLVSPDSRFALLFDDDMTFLAPLADRKQPTFLLAAYDETAFCAETGTFWGRDDAGVSVVTATTEAAESRLLGGSSSPAFSWEKRFIAIETSEPSSVIVTPCSISGVSTVYEAAFAPVLGPGSETILVSMATGGQKLFSLENPAAQVELWSSSVALVDPTFSSDGAHLVGSVDDTLYVADLRDASRPPVSFGLPADASFADVYPQGGGGWQDLVGKTAALVWVPTEDSEGRELLWQPLNPSQERQSLLVDPDQSSVEILLSQHDLGQVFIVAEEAELQHLKRLRLDTEQPVLEELFALESHILDVELAPDGSGLLVHESSELILSTLHWAALDRDGQVKPPVSISKDVLNYAFEPWR